MEPIEVLRVVAGALLFVCAVGTACFWATFCLAVSDGRVTTRSTEHLMHYTLAASGLFVACGAAALGLKLMGGGY
jgi:hypothetical protein